MMTAKEALKDVTMLSCRIQGSAWLVKQQKAHFGLSSDGTHESPGSGQWFQSQHSDSARNDITYTASRCIWPPLSEVEFMDRIPPIFRTRL